MIAEMFLPNGMTMLGGLWIPLCFLVIPSVHALARQNRDLRARLDALDRQIATDDENVLAVGQAVADAGGKIRQA
mgnify:CR=1 FL=1